MARAAGNPSRKSAHTEKSTTRRRDNGALQGSGRLGDSLGDHE
jgi:hypothetical protein